MCPGVPGKDGLVKQARTTQLMNLHKKLTKVLELGKVRLPFKTLQRCFIPKKESSFKHGMIPIELYKWMELHHPIPEKKWTFINKIKPLFTSAYHNIWEAWTTSNAKNNTPTSLVDLNS